MKLMLLHDWLTPHWLQNVVISVAVGKEAPTMAIVSPVPLTLVGK